MTSRRSNWRTQAACLSHDPELFFPIGTTGPALEQTAHARQICSTCVVRPSCLEFAVSHRIDHGVWGGLDSLERRSLLRSHSAPRS